MRKNELQLLKKTVFCLFLICPLWALHGNSFPNTFAVFRDAVYLQNANSSEITRLYNRARQDIETCYTGVDLYLTLSRCEYLMGIAARAEGRKNEAASFFEQGIAYAEKAIQINPTSEGYRLLGTNISFLCEVRRSYGLKNYGKIERAANQALELDPDNIKAKYLIAAFYVVAPWPVSNLQKGAAMLEEILNQNYLSMDNEDLFNLYLMLQVAAAKQKKHQEAQFWGNRAAELYSTNNFISLLIK